MVTYSMDLRERVVAAVKGEGLSRRAAAKRFGISYSAAIEWLKLVDETGSVRARKVGGGKPKKLSGAWREWLIERCREKDFTLRGLVAELGECGLLTSWYSVRADEQHIAARGAWQHTNLPAHASELQARVAFAWRAMDAFYEEDERIVGHAADPYHRIDIRQASRNLVVRHRNRIIADTKRPVVLYESGFAPRWYVPRADIDESALTPVKLQTFCPYKGLCSYYSIDDARLAAWSYPDAYPEVRRISNLVSFEPDIVSVHLDGTQLHLEPGQTVVPHGPDRNLDVAEVVHERASGGEPAAAASG